MKKFNTRTLASIALAIAAPIAGFAQLVNDGAKISVDPGTFLIIDDLGFQNNAGGEVSNSGEIHVDGNWTNNDPNGVFGPSPTALSGGMVRLTGGAQSMGGTNATNFFNVSSEGTAASIKSLTSDQNVHGTITINNSYVRLNAQTLTVENTSPTAVTTVGSGFLISEDAGAAFNSRLRWRIPNGTTGNYLIPWGTSTVGTVSIPFRYNKTTSGTISGGGPSQYTVFATRGTGALNTPLPAGVPYLTDDYQQTSHFWVMDRYWLVDNDFQGNFSTYPNVSYTFGYDDVNEIAAPNHITEANLVAQRFNNVNNVWLDWLYSPTANTGANTVTVNLANALDYFPVWTLVDQSDPLPIELAYFKAECDRTGDVNVTWTTWTETRNSYFTVQRSEDGVNFTDVGRVNGAVNSNTAINYSLKDEDALGGTSFYRLQMTDTEGRNTYSQIVAVTCQDQTTDFDLVNAYDQFHENIVVEFTAGLNESYTVKLYDSGGKIIMDQTGKSVDGFNRVVMPSGNLATGIYVVNLSNDSKSLSKRVALR